MLSRLTRMAWCLLGLACATAATAAPEMHSLTVRTPHVERYGRFELSADITGEWRNPFDPDQIDVSAEFTAPSGKGLRVPGFWVQGYSESPPATEVRQQVEALTLFAYAADWREGAQLELFVDDITLIDEAGMEIPFDDMESGDAPRAIAVEAPPLTFSTEVVHGGARSLRLAPRLEGGSHWPAVLYQPGRADWSRHRGAALWVYPRCDTDIGPLWSYYVDSEWGKSRMAIWEPRNGTLRVNCWNRLETVWPEHWPPVKLEPRGAPEWRVRFTPVEVGQYGVRLAARDRTGRSVSAESTLRVAPSKLPGFVRISQHDPHYFAFDDGSPFVPIGHDVPLGLPDVRACYPEMRAHGENATYFILCPYDLSFEWAELGVYDLDRAARIDRVLDAARDNGIYLKLSFDVHDAWRASGWWATSPYNAPRGGPCASPNDLYTSEAAWDHYRKRVRYIAARWGYSPNMMAWEPVAELDGATVLAGIEGWGYTRRPGGEETSAKLAPFLQRLGRYLVRLDPYDRLFTTSYGGDTSDDTHWALPEVDYTQIHCYDSADPSETLSRWARDLTSRFDKPMMVTEFGPGLDGPAPGIDPEGINLHNGIWASLLGGAAGCALNWHWEFIDAFGWYRHYPPLRECVSGIDWPREGFAPSDLEVTTPDRGRTMRVETAIPGERGFGDVTIEEYSVRPDGTPEGAARPPMYLLAPGRTEPRVCPRFVVDFPSTSTFTVDVGQVCPDARLELSLDGEMVRTVELPVRDVPGKPSLWNEQYGLWWCDYRESYSIDVPAGRHEIQVANARPGSSWLQVRAYRLSREEPVALQVLGLTGRSAVLLWVHNRESIWSNWDRPAPPPIAGARLVVRGAPPGKLRAEWLDTWTGEAIRNVAVQARAGRLTLDVPPVSGDVACRVLPARY